jgi:hypothetical protein
MKKFLISNLIKQKMDDLIITFYGDTKKAAKWNFIIPDIYASF